MNSSKTKTYSLGKYFKSVTRIKNLNLQYPSSMFQKFVRGQAESNTIFINGSGGHPSPTCTTPGNRFDPLFLQNSGSEKIVPDSATPSFSPIEEWTQNLSKTTPQTCTREILPDCPPTPENNSPIGEPTPENPNTRYFSKKLQRSVTVSREKKRSSSAISKRKTKSTQISGEKQRLISTMLGIVPLGSSTDQDLAGCSQVLENESTNLED